MLIVLFTRVLSGVETLVMLSSPLDRDQHEDCLNEPVTKIEKVLEGEGWKETTEQHSDHEFNKDPHNDQYQLYFFEGGS